MCSDSSRIFSGIGRIKNHKISDYTTWSELNDYNDSIPPETQRYPQSAL